MAIPPRAPTPVALLLATLDSAFDKQSWHGPNFTSSIRGLKACKALAKPPGRKCAWEQVLHAAYWKHRALVLLTGPMRFPRPGSDWPPIPEPADEAAWRADVQLLRDLHRKLRAAVKGLDRAALKPKTIWLIQGAAAHDVYHAGQIKLLRRLVAA